MTERRHVSPVVRYYCYQVTLSLGFYVPVSVLYLRDRGFSLAFVGLAGAVFSFSLLLAEVPTGYLADRLGRRGTLALGSACRVVGVGGYAVADAAATFLALKVVLGVGWALRSGTADAYLYELLAATGEADRFATVTGRGRAALLTASAVTAVLGGVGYELAPRAPFLANAALAALGVPLLASLPAATAETDREHREDRFGVRDALASLRRVAGRTDLRWVVVYAVLVLVAFDVTRSFEQPAYRSVGVDAARLGLLYAGFKLVSAAGGAVAGPLRERLGTRRTLAALAPLVGATYGVLLFVPAFVLVVGFCYRSLRSVLLPVRNQYLNDRLPDAGRATVLSGVSMLLSLVGGVARVVAGGVADALGPVDVVAVAGVTGATLACAVWLGTAPVRDGGVADGADPSRAAAD